MAQRKGTALPSQRPLLCITLSLLLTFIVCMIMWSKYVFTAALFGAFITSRPLGDVKALDAKSYRGMPSLHFNQEGSFKISVLEDLHFGEAEDLGWGPEQDRKSVEVIRTVLDVEIPDLVVLNGDLITGENTYLHNATHYLDQIVGPLVSSQIPWASTYGNHDQQFNLSSERLLERELTRFRKFSYTRSMISSPDAGVSNFVLPIYASTDSKGTSTPAALLWFFDSKGGSKYRVENPDGKDPDSRRIPIGDFVHTSVVDWFVQTNADIVQQYGHRVPSLAFVHIPAYSMKAFQQTIGVDPEREPGINDDIPLSPQSIQTGFYTAQDVPFMKALVDAGVKAVFSGHDHGNDWCFRWDSLLDDMTIAGTGIFNCFGRHTGYGGYGNWTRGSRQILLHEDTLNDAIATWIRLEDATINGSILLNKTYGSDVYGAT